MKRGRPYEIVVSEIVKAFLPKATVEQGRWIKGPDGLRDMDVFVSGTLEGRPLSILIECKDYDPASTGKVGIEVVDALSSKSKDLKTTASIICSNAGFTEDAIKKANRVGIGLISVVRSGDSRIRFLVTDEIYARRLKVESYEIILESKAGTIDLSAVKDPAEITFDGVRLSNWIEHRVAMILGTNPIVNGRFSASYRLTSEINLKVKAAILAVSNIKFIFSIVGDWFVHLVEIATQGIYDWLKHSFIMSPYNGKFQYEIKNIDIVNGGKLISRPPGIEEFHKSRSPEGDIRLDLLLIEGLSFDGKIPEIDKYVYKDDLDSYMPKIPLEALTSHLRR